MTDPFSGLGVSADASLLAGVPTINDLLAADATSGTGSTSTSSSQPSTQQLLSQIPVWVWVVLGGSLLIVLMASER